MLKLAAVPLPGSSCAAAVGSTTLSYPRSKTRLPCNKRGCCRARLEKGLEVLLYPRSDHSAARPWASRNTGHGSCRFTPLILSCWTGWFEGKEALVPFQECLEGWVASWHTRLGSMRGREAQGASS